MSNLSIQLPPGVRFELAFGSVIAGKEAQLFIEYFPKVGPIVAGHGGQSTASFAVHDSVTELPAPSMGALFQWPTIAAYDALHKDEGFQAIKALRDEAMAHLSNGHFFAVDTMTTATFDPEQIYAVLITPEDTEVPEAVLSLKLAADSTNRGYADRKFTIANWTPGTEALLQAGGNSAEVYKIKFNPPKPN